MILKKIAHYQDFFIDDRASIKDAIVKMNLNGDGSVVLIDENKPTAILTQSNIINAIEKNMDLSKKAYSIATTSVITINEDRPVDFAFSFLSEHNIRRLVLINEKEEFSGIVLQESLFDYMEENTYKIDLQILHILEKNLSVYSIDKSASLYDALELMKEKHIGSVIVINGKDTIGILTEKDILKLLCLDIDLDSNIQRYMSTPVIKVTKDTLVIQGISLIRRKNIRRVLVTDTEDNPVTILSSHDIFKHLKGKRQDGEYLMMQQFKLATMGEMIGHIAHQWRQPLAQLGGVFMNLDSAYEFDELNQNYLKDKVKNGTELIEYMSNTIEDFRNFFVPKSNKEVFEVNECIKSATNIIQATLVYHHIELEIITSEEPAHMNGYPNEFSQVILNLVNNAKDILLQRAIVSPSITIETMIKKNQIIILVKDNAGGIDNAIINKIFDIYFTTKSKDGGTGLGLYISRLIIENKLMGDITVSNGTDGAIFSIYLNKNEFIL
ncbi:MAG: hypothetical protein DRG78_23700 [Epsilonproteobacteria bacterium]|nr:MAG: hypothetical protein DRG78_23700 [Campylobacterota bacterium]